VNGMKHKWRPWKVLYDGRSPTLDDAAAGRLAKASCRIDAEPGQRVAAGLRWAAAVRVVSRANDKIAPSRPWCVAVKDGASCLVDGNGEEVADSLNAAQADAIAAAYNAG